MKVDISFGSRIKDVLPKILKYPWSVPVIGLAIALIGFALELKFCESYFQRFGSVMVAFVVLVVYIHYYIKKYSESLREAADNFRVIKESPALRQKMLNNLPAHAHRVMQLSSDTLLRKAEELENNLEKSSSNLAFGEAFIGVLGTLIWGFGDLITKFGLKRALG